MGRRTQRRREMLTVTLDATSAGRLVVGIVAPGRRTLVNLRYFPGHHEVLVRSIVRTLERNGVALADIGNLLVVAGPGRFSNLRATATVANVLRAALGTKLFSVVQPRFSPRSADAYLADLLKRKKRVEQIRPHYGKPASITRPKAPIG